MIITQEDLNEIYQDWFRNCNNSKQAKTEILAMFDTEPDEFAQWTFQDIYEQSRKIIKKYER